MILVTLGTQDKDFSRLLEAIDEQIKKKKIKDKVIVQAGYTKYESSNMEIFDLISPDELEELVKKCRVLITHGGVGSILLGLKYQKPIIAAARLKKYKEHTNDHQKQIIKEFEKDGYLLALNSFDRLDQILEKAKTFKPNKYQSNTDHFIDNINQYIEKDNHTSWFNKYLQLTSKGYRGILFSILNLLFFSFCSKNISLLNSIVISFFLTTILSFLCHKAMDIKYQLKSYIILNIIFLMSDFLCFYFKIYFNIIIVKLLINIFCMIISFGILRFIVKE